VRVVPARLSPVVASGACDAGLIPVVDYLRGVGERIISDACIGSTGAVRSVLMFSRVAPALVRTVAVDTSSHSSVALLRVLLADHYENQPPFTAQPPDLHAMLADHDGALLIGDKALEAVAPAGRAGYQILDLGADWKEMTGKPFVFAAWVARRGLEMELAAELSQLLTSARNDGESRLTQVVRNNPIQTSLTPAQVEDYLRHAVDFHLTGDHRDGLEEFRRRCEKYGLLDAGLVG
jgi:chorismate dehydratase